MTRQAYRESHRNELSQKQKDRYWSDPEKYRAQGREHYAGNRDRIKKRQSEYRLNHLEQERQSHLRWKERNREYHLAQKRRHHALNRDRIHAQKREYYQRNKEAIKAKVAAYVKAHPEVPCNTGAKRRALKRNTQIDVSGIKQWMKEQRALPFVRCHWCGTKVRGRKIQFDHVIPLNRNGTHTIGNLCASCRDCNYSKHDRLVGEWMRHGQTFLPL